MLNWSAFGSKGPGREIVLPVAALTIDTGCMLAANGAEPLALSAVNVTAP